MTSTTEYNSKTGLCLINTANTNLDGTGAIQQIIVASSPVGTATGYMSVRSVTIKAIQATTQGMIRFFVGDGISFWLIKEIMVPEYTPTSILPAFSMTVSLPLVLKPGDRLYATTQNSESFNIFADCLSIGSCACSSGGDCCSNAEYEAVNGVGNISIANSNLDGSGSKGLIFTAGGAGNSVTKINSIVVKATQDITQGMIRLFVFDGSNYYLFCELPVNPSTINGGILPAFTMTIPANFCLQKGYGIYASTENAESFNVWVNGVTINSCGCSQ